MFKVGELIKRKTVNVSKAKAVCVVVDKDSNNYTVFNSSLKCLQQVAIPVIEGLYDTVQCIQKYTVVSVGDLHMLVYTFLYGVGLCDCICFDTVVHKDLVRSLSITFCQALYRVKDILCPI